jgi:hypothetical protein
VAVVTGGAAGIGFYVSKSNTIILIIIFIIIIIIIIIIVIIVFIIFISIMNIIIDSPFWALM